MSMNIFGHPYLEFLVFHRGPEALPVLKGLGDPGAQVLPARPVIILELILGFLWT